jgi:hypothetical protein
MKIPAFKRSKRFLGEFTLPCLVAEVKNSELPGVAARYIAEFNDDPSCEIYLRGENPGQMSKWQMDLLEQLFVKAKLSAAIEEAMQRYGKSPEAYDDANTQERQEIREHGIAPFITIATIVIDEIRKEVILVAGTECDGNLSEHGISIYLHKGRWRFDYADYFTKYQKGFQKSLTMKELVKERSELIKTMAGTLSSMMSHLNERDKKFEELFPASGPSVKSNPQFLYGDWLFDSRKAAEVLQKLGCDQDEIDSDLEHHGTRSGSILKSEHWCDGKFIVKQTGLAYRRGKGVNP